jgi:hypothetical protein
LFAGHLEVLKYLKEGFGLGKEDAQSEDNYALKWSAKNGHLEVLKYLQGGHLGWARRTPGREDNYALKWSAENGHLEVLKYLKEGFGLDKEDAHLVRQLRPEVEC